MERTPNPYEYIPPLEDAPTTTDGQPMPIERKGSQSGRSITHVVPTDPIALQAERTAFKKPAPRGFGRGVRDSIALHGRRIALLRRTTLPSGKYDDLLSHETLADKFEEAKK